MSKSKKLAFCVLRYFPYGGVQRDMMGVVNQAISQGYLVDIYCLTWEGRKPIELDSNNQKTNAINVIEVPVLAWSNHARAKKFAAKLKQIFNQKSYYRIISFNRLPYTDVCFIGDHCFLEHLKNKNSRFAKYLPRYKNYSDLEKGVFESNSQVVLITDAERKVYEKYFPEKKNNIHLIAPWVQEKILPEEQAEKLRITYREKFNIQQNQFLLLFMASQFQAKGLDRALLAVSSLPEDLKSQVKILVAGAGKKDFCIAKIKEYSIENQAIYLGPRDDAQALMCAADIFIHPARVELAGKVLLEAIINNLAVLTTEACGCAPYIIEAKSGEVISGRFTQEKLNQALVSMLSQERLSQYRAHANNYQHKTSFANFPQLFMNIIESAPGMGAESFYIGAQLQGEIPNKKTACLDKMFSLSGKIYREVKERKTMAVELNNQHYFIKLHNGVGWQEIFKNLIFFRLPVVSAKQEVTAIRALEKLNIKTLTIAAYAEQGINPAKRKSFLLTHKIDYQLTLEDLAIEWQKTKPNFKFKRAIIKRVAEIARTMHQNNINHRDFYICHFLLNKKTDHDFDLILIDLHRALVHKNKLPTRWLIKDLAGLYFSSMGAGLSQKDYFYFLTRYCQCDLKTFNQQYAHIWKEITSKALKLYAKNNS